MKNIYLEQISLTDYRNFSELSFAPGKHINIIIGPNGSGKSNILESISLLSPGKGIKSANFDEICKYGCSHWRTQFRLQSKLGIAEIDTIFEEQQRSRKINYNASKISSTELTNLLNLVWFSPQMDSIFLASASIRRRFLDRIAYNFNSNHVKALSNYDYFIKERSKILLQKNWESEAEWLSVVERKIATEAILIEKARNQTIISIQKAIDGLNTEFTKPKLALTKLFEQQNYFDELEPEYSKELLNNRRKDCYSRRTNFGVHRSDLIVMHTEKSTAAKFCSTGEQKAMLISIILAIIEAMLINNNSNPILLLDELFVHLDKQRKEQLSDYIISTKLQTFITSTDIVGIEDLATNSNVIKL